jgi:hypothetical protein
MDIDTSNKLLVHIELKIHRNPQFTFTVNDIELTGMTSNLKLDLLDEIVIRCINSGDGAVEIVDLSVNSNHILPLYLHYATPPTHWIENISQWELKITAPFYTWYQEITGGGWVA